MLSSSSSPPAQTILPPHVSADRSIGGRRATDLVAPDGSAVNRELFVDDTLYRLEQERIFARCWLYIGHQTQLPEIGSFLSTTMGEDPIFVVRDASGRLRAFLNSCSHRGAKVCRAETGKTAAFRCPYHAWTFNTSGELIGVPRERDVFPAQFDRAEFGLREVAQLDTFGGLTFATWDPAAPSLQEYLGGMTFYLDLMLNRMPGGTELLDGVHKWTVDVNWKIPSENFAGDHYHVPSTHQSGIEMGYRAPLTNNGYCIQTGNGHSIGSEHGGAQQGDAVQTAYKEFLEGMRARITAEHGPQMNDLIPIGVGTLFPNLSFMDTARFRTVRVWHPRGPAKIEIHSYCLVDAALPPELKAATRRQYTLAFGPGGIFEQDDGDVWTSIQEALRGPIGRQGSFHYHMGQGREQLTSARYGAGFPGWTSDLLMTESNQRAYYRRWAQLMVDEVAP